MKTHSIMRPAGVTALGLFFIFGMLVSGLSATSLLTQSAILEPMWQIKPAVQGKFAQMGLWAPILLAAVCLVCAAAAWGFYAGSRWGYRLGVGILVTNLLGDTVTSLTGGAAGAWIGIPIVVLVLWYLSSRKVKSFFSGTT